MHANPPPPPAPRPGPFPASLQTCDHVITRSAGFRQLNLTPDFPKSFRLTQCERRPRCQCSIHTCPGAVISLG